MKRRNRRRRALSPLSLLSPLLVAALLLASPGEAAAAPSAPVKGAGVTVEGVWERVWGWVVERLGLDPIPDAPTGEEGGGIDPNGRKSGGNLLGEEGGGIDPNG